MTITADPRLADRLHQHGDHTLASACEWHDEFQRMTRLVKSLRARLGNTDQRIPDSELRTLDGWDLHVEPATVEGESGVQVWVEQKAG